MKICFLASANSVHIQRRIRYFQKNGHEVHIITFREADVGNVTIHYLKPKSYGLIGKALFFILKLWKVKRLIQEINPDILHAHYITSYGLIGASSGLHPLVITAIGSDILSDCTKSIVFKKINRFALKKANIITAGTDYMIEKITELGIDREKVIKISFGIDLRMFNIEVRDQFKDNRNPSLLSFRAFNEQHNVELLIKALPHVLKQIPQLDIIIIGEGSQGKKIKNLAKKLRISERTRFLGTVPHETIPYYLGKADIYVSTSLSDSEHVSLQEAMACGAFPVVTDIPVNREWIKDGQNGFLVPTNDPEILAKKICESISASRLRENAQEYNQNLIQRRLLYEDNLKKLEDIYYELSGRK